MQYEHPGRLSRTAFTAALLVSAFVACAEEAGETRDIEMRSHGLIAEVQLSPTHTIVVSETQPGVLEGEESGGPGDEPLLTNSTLEAAELYEAVLGDKLDAKTLAKLKEAGKRVKSAQAELDEAAAPPVDEHLVSDEALGEKHTSTVPCSTGSWGGNWAAIGGVFDVNRYGSPYYAPTSDALSYVDNHGGDYCPIIHSEYRWYSPSQIGGSTGEWRPYRSHQMTNQSQGYWHTYRSTFKWVKWGARRQQPLAGYPCDPFVGLFNFCFVDKPL